VKWKAPDPLAAPAKLIGSAAAGVTKVGRWLSGGLHLAGMNPWGQPAGRIEKPGQAAGIESFADIDKPPGPDEVRIAWTDFSVERIETVPEGSIDQLVAAPRPEWAAARWINVDGLHPYIVNRLRSMHAIHTLAAEDVLRTAQRPKLESYESGLFVVARMLALQEGSLRQEQVSFFLFEDTLITFQESKGDVWDPIRARLQKAGSRLRTFGPAYLMYALLDALVDHCFPILETYGEILEDLEDSVVRDPQPEAQRQIHRIKRELSVLRRVLWPLREVINELQREETEEIPAAVKPYFRDVYDHAVQVMDIVETYREQASSLNDLYMSSVANRMNEIMKVLTIMASFFIPITFVAGVYGMNFE
jgi:magnesium transporter